MADAAQLLDAIVPFVRKRPPRAVLPRPEPVGPMIEQQLGPVLPPSER